jgi:hypothetical protein
MARQQGKERVAAGRQSVVRQDLTIGGGSVWRRPYGRAKVAAKAQLSMSSPSPSPKLSIVIPARDAAALLPSCLASLEEGRVCGLVGEVIVVDGGSGDDTAARAGALGARVVVAPSGRGPQLAAGAAAASGEWLLFLHADCRLARDGRRRSPRFSPPPTRVPAPGISASRWTIRARRRGGWSGVALALPRLGLPYGDQGLLIARSLYLAVGGFVRLAADGGCRSRRRVSGGIGWPLDATAVELGAALPARRLLRRPLRNLSACRCISPACRRARIARLYG